MTNKLSDNLYKVILKLETLDEAKRFFRDLLTEAEILEFSNRWQAAQMLDQNVPYEQIIEKTHLSSRTIARISKWLNSGMGGYKNMITKINNHHHTTSSEKGLC